MSISYDRKFVIWGMAQTILTAALFLSLGWVIWGGRCDPPVILNYYNFNDLIVGEVKPVVIPVETITAEVTAYTASPEETDSTPEIMASGKKIYKGAIACPRRISFGTIVKIDDDWFVCEDRLAERYDHRFDILMFSKEEAIEWGRREKQLTIYQ